ASMWRGPPPPRGGGGRGRRQKTPAPRGGRAEAPAHGRHPTAGSRAPPRPPAPGAGGGAARRPRSARGGARAARTTRARRGAGGVARAFRARAGYWRNVWTPHATAAAGYIEERNENGSWPATFDPAAEDGFAEGSSAQYSWMVPFDAAGLVAAMGGRDAFRRRLDAFFHLADGSWALTGLGGEHAELDNEPSLGAPWLYLWAGAPYRTQET